MIKFKQKEFFVGGALLAGTSVIGVVQGAKGNKIAQQQGQQQQAEIERANREQARIMKQQQEQQANALKKITAAAQKNPMAGANTVQAMQASYSGPVFRQKEYGATFNRANLKGFANDMSALMKKRGSGQKAMNMLVEGAAIGATAYGADKLIQHDIKKNGGEINVPEKTEEQKQKEKNKKLLTAGLTTAATVGAFAAGRRGYLGKGVQRKTNVLLGKAGNTIGSNKLVNSAQKGWMESTGKTAVDFNNRLNKGFNFKSNIKNLGNSAKEGVKNIAVTKDATTGKNKINAMGLAIPVVFGAATPLTGYYTNKQNSKNQIEQSQQQFSEQDENGSSNGIKRKALTIAGTTAAAAGLFAAGKSGRLGNRAARVTNNLWARTGKAFGNQKMVQSGTSGWAKAAAKTKAGKTLANGDNIDIENFIKNNQSRYESIYKNKVKNNSLLKDTGVGFKKAGKGVLDFMSMGYGRSGQKQIGNELKEVANKDANGKISNPITEKFSNRLINPKHAAVAAVGGLVAGPLAMKPWSMGEKAVKGATGLVDKNSMAYEKSQEQQVV